MHILILTFGFPSKESKNKTQFYGGSFLLPEARAYASAGAKVTVLTMHAFGLPLKETIGKGIDVVRVPYFLPFRFEKIRLPNYPLYTKKKIIVRLMQLPFFIVSYCVFLGIYTKKSDLIHANWTPTAFLALPFSRLFNKPIFLTFRGSDITKLPSIFNRFTIRYVDGVFKWQLGDVTRYSKKFKGKYINLPLIAGIMPPSSIKKKFSSFNSKQKNVNFLFIGRLTFDKVQRLKGVDILMLAVHQLISKFNQKGQFKVHIVGDGPAINNLLDQQRRLELQEHVFFYGHQQNITPFLQESHAVLGGIGLNAVTQEAALSACLLIMVEGIEWVGEIWRDKLNSVHYKPGDPESLALAMNYVIENLDNAKKIASQGNKSIKIYTATVDEGGKAYLSYFRKLIRQKR